MHRTYNVKMNPRMRTTAGTANFKKGLITLNPGIHEHDANGYENFVDTCIHEFAHLLAPIVDPRRGRGHGPVWVAVMNAMGLSGDRCHSMDLHVAKRSHKIKTIATCGCKGREYKIKTIRFKKMVEGTEYSCRACGKTLKPGPEVQAERDRQDLIIAGHHSTLPKGIQKLLKRYRHVLDPDRPISDERGDEGYGGRNGNGFWLYLRPGFINSDDGMHLVHEWTVADVASKLRSVEKCDCDECQWGIEQSKNVPPCPRVDSKKGGR